MDLLNPPQNVPPIEEALQRFYADDIAQAKSRRDAMSPLERAWQRNLEENAEQEFADRGFLRGLASDVAGGLLVDAPETLLRAARTYSPGEATDDQIGKELKQLETFQSEHPFYQRNPNATGISRSIHEGVRSAVHSLGVGAGGIVTGGLMGGPVGAIAGFALAGGGAFGAAEYDQSMEAFRPLIEAGKITEEDAKQGALISAAAEGGFEALANTIEGVTFGAGTLLKTPAKSVGKTALKGLFAQSWKDLVTRQAITIGTELASELPTAAVQAGVRRDLGVSNQSVWDAMKDAFGPTVVAAAIFGGVGEVTLGARRRALQKSIIDGALRPEQRLGAIDEVYAHVKRYDDAVAQTWLRSSLAAVAMEQDINPDSRLEDDLLAGVDQREDVIRTKPVWERNINTIIDNFTAAGLREQADQARKTRGELYNRYRKALVDQKAKEFQEGEVSFPDETPEDAILAGEFDDAQAFDDYQMHLKSLGLPTSSKPDLMNDISVQISLGKWDRQAAMAYGRRNGLSPQDVETAMATPPRETKIQGAPQPPDDSEQPTGPAAESAQVFELARAEEERVRQSALGANLLQRDLASQELMGDQPGQLQGRGLIFRRSGRPFKTYKEAEIDLRVRAKRDGLQADIIPVEGGFALQPFRRGETMGPAEESAQVFEQARADEERVRQSPIGAQLLRQDLSKQDLIILQSNGQPFRTFKSADIARKIKAKRENQQTEVVSVEGGFGLRPVERGLPGGSEDAETIKKTQLGDDGPGIPPSGQARSEPDVQAGPQNLFDLPESSVRTPTDYARVAEEEAALSEQQRQGLYFRRNGSPWNNERAAAIARPGLQRRFNKQLTVVPVEGGFALQDAEQVQALAPAPVQGILEKDGPKIPDQVEAAEDLASQPQPKPIASIQHIPDDTVRSDIDILQLPSQRIIKAIKARHPELTGLGAANYRRKLQKIAKEAPPILERLPETPTVSNDKMENGKPPDNLSAWVVKKLRSSEALTWQELFTEADQVYGGTQAEGTYSVKDAYDALELGVNKFLAGNVLQEKEISPQQPNVTNAQNTAEDLNKLVGLVPTQTKRTDEQVEYQQFSTPPALAYAVVRVANIRGDDVVLEPSAGIGGLAIFAKLSGAKEIIVNELSPRRAEFLRLMGFDRVFTENAEQLNNILPADVKPTVIIMNPPFSATAGRKAGYKNTKIGAQHVEQALKRLQPGGRLVAIVGRGMGADKKSFTGWWNKIKKVYNVRANVAVSGKDYRKYGTTFDNQILVIDKTGPTVENIITGEVKSASELIPLLEGVRNERRSGGRDVLHQRDEGTGRRPQAADRPGQRPFGQPESTGVSSGKEGEGGSRQPLRGPSDGVVDSEPVGGTRGSTGGELDTTPDGGISQPDSGNTGSGLRTQRQESDQNLRSPGRDGDTGRDVVRAGRGLSEEEPTGVSENNTATRGELTDSLYDDYRPKRKFKGAQKHPTPLAQSSALAAVDLPPTKYQHKIPQDIIAAGNLSDAQLEQIVYAGHAHEQVLPNGQRRGYFIGDGTGVGKGREISGIIYDNWRQGRKKAVWITEKTDLYKDAQRDLEGIGWEEGAQLIFPHNKIKVGQKIQSDEGVLFTTFDTVRGSGQSHYDSIDPEKTKSLEDMKVRLNQLVDWFGRDYDGVIVFDEAHNMGNALDMPGGRGVKKASAKAQAGMMLQDLLPNARVVYSSATGATEVQNLGYLSRLGLWGEGTPFPDQRSFISEITKGGLAAMELVSKDMKAMGLYNARTLAYSGVKYDRLTHALTDEQRIIYDTLAEAWQGVLQDISSAIEVSNGGRQAQALAHSQFWGAHQRFFNQIITAMQMPSVLERIDADLENGRSVVIQLVNTMEAAQERAVNTMGPGDKLEDIDLSPKEILMNFVERSFPTDQWETFTDENGNERSRRVRDSAGNVVQNQEAVQMRDELLDSLASIRVPSSVLEILFDKFGHQNIAEVTGRKRRVVWDEEKGERILQPWSKVKGMADVDAFQRGDKRILVFSNAGGTGRSFHADMNAGNQQQRIHYLVQPGWRADSAVQGFGRTHRSNQKQPPEYVLVTTDLKGQARFLSSIARRLDQLGALTKGQRKAGSQGIFQAKDNLESKYAEAALENLITDIKENTIQHGGRWGHYTPLDISVAEFEKQTGIRLFNDEGESLETPSITQFLNRLLSLKYDLQNDVFQAFSERMDEVIRIHSEAGTLDVGMETLRGDKIEKIREETVFQDQRSGAETKYVQVEVTNPAVLMPYQQAATFDGGFYRNIKSGKIWAAGKQVTRTAHRTGDVIPVRNLVNVSNHRQSVDVADLENSDKWEKLKKLEAKKIWNEAYDQAPKTVTSTKHIATGALLPIWDRLLGNPKIYRLKTDEGEVMLGREISPKYLDRVLSNLGVGVQESNLSPQEVSERILKGQTAHLANGWRIQSRKVSGDRRLEIRGPGFADRKILIDQGVFTERINSNLRYFIPVGADTVPVLSRVLNNRPVVSFGEVQPGLQGEADLSVTRTPVRRGVKAVSARLAIEPIVRNWKNRPAGGIHVVETVADLPKRVRGRVEKTINQRSQYTGKTYRVKGLRDAETNAVYIISSSHPDTDSVIKNLLHEVVGHDGLKAVLGDEYNKFLNRLWWAKVREIKAVGQKAGIDTRTVAGRRKAADEWFAQQVAEGDFQDTWWTRFVRLVQDALQKMGMDIRLTDADIAGLVAAAHGYFEGGKPKAKIERGWMDLSGEQTTTPGIDPVIKSKKIEVVTIRGDEIASGKTRREFRKIIREYFQKNLMGKSFRNKDQGWNIRISEEGKSHFINHLPTIPEAQSAFALPDIITNMVLVKTDVPSPDMKDQRYNHLFVGGIQIADNLYRIKTVVKESLQGQKYYDHRLTTIERPDTLRVPQRNESPIINAFPGPSKIILADLFPDINLEDALKPGVRFSRRSLGESSPYDKPGGLRKQAVENIVGRLRFNVNVQVAQSVDDLPADYRASLDDQISRGYYPRGFFDTQETIWVIADHLADDVDVIRAVIHEGIGHYGIEKILGKDAARFFRQIGLAKRRDVKRLAGEFGVSLDEASREWFAEAVESGRLEQTWWDKFVAMVRRTLRAMGVKSDWLNRLTDDDIKAMAAEAGRVAKGRQTQKQTSSLSSFAKQGPDNSGKILFSRRQAESFLKDDLRTTLATIKDYWPDRHKESKRGTISNLLWSAEYWDDPVGKRIFDATQKREDRRLSIFNKTLDSYQGLKSISSKLTEMKFRGMPKGKRFAGLDLFDPDQVGLDRNYKAVWEIIDHMDVNEETWHSQMEIDRARVEEESNTLSRLFAMGYRLEGRLKSDEIKQKIEAYEIVGAGRHLPIHLQELFDEEELKAGYKAYTTGYRDKMLAENVPEEIITAVDAFRQARDRELELQRNEIAEIIHAYNKAEMDVPVLPEWDIETKGGQPKAKTLIDAYREMGDLKGFYAPRIRERGDWHVLSEKDGQHYRFGTASRWRARHLAVKLERQGHKIEKDKEGKPYHAVEKIPENVHQQLTIGAVSQVLEQAAEDVTGIDPDTRAKMRLEMIRTTSDLLKSRGLRIPKISRSGRHGNVVKGYIEDPLTRHILSAQRIAGGIAKGEAAMNMMEALNGVVRVYTRSGNDWVLHTAQGVELDRRPMTEGEKKDDSIRTKRIVVQEGINAAQEPAKHKTYTNYINEQLRNPDQTDRVIGVAKSIASLKYLGFNPRSAVVNLTALPLTVPPAIHQYVLEGKGHIRSVMVAVSKAAVDYGKFMAKKRADLNADEQTFLTWLQENGYDAPQLTREAMSSIQTGYGRAWSNTMTVAMWMFGKTEQLNRGATMLAAYRMAKKKYGTEKSEKEVRALARFASDRAHGVYGTPSLPMWAQGQNPAAQIARMGFMFQKFGHNYLQMMLDLGWKRRNWKALAYGLGAPAVVGGLASSAVAAVAFALLKGIMSAFGDDREPEKMLYDMIREQFGDTGEQAARYGLVGVFPGIDLSSSLAIGMQLPKNLMDLTGPIGGVVQDIGTAKRSVSTGRPLRAVEQAAPNVLRNMIRAYRELDGATTRSGNRIWDDDGKPYVPGGWETAKRMAGFGASRRAALGARQWESKKELAGFAERRNRIYERYRAYLAKGDFSEGEFQDIMAGVRAYNEAVRQKGRAGLVPLITQQSLKRQVRSMDRPSKRQRAMLQ